MPKARASFAKPYPSAWVEATTTKAETILHGKVNRPKTLQKIKSLNFDKLEKELRPINKKKRQAIR